MQRLEQAVVGLDKALCSDSQLSDSWRPRVSQHLVEVREALAAERTHASETWLSARAGHLHRERIRLLSRLTALSGLLSSGTGDDEVLHQELLRLVHDIAHHHQRVNDLAYDSVAMEVGGSE